MFWCYIINVKYAFLDANNSKNKTAIFESKMLGYNQKKGRWLAAFDGIFYIKTNQVSTSIY